MFENFFEKKVSVQTMTLYKFSKILTFCHGKFEIPNLVAETHSVAEANLVAGPHLAA